ncbi:hypothetical protein LSH36_832g01038 [Paralvinella palmiformis]|uniref:Uncharacterized protein n=1 Tax=Paralvinella palmiformis TaxID=53620 RepID=A0AAD9IZE7_9ANNE|nr:hypothetical protein LSH36_832g01038 [Paralvinella palmiformis]
MNENSILAWNADGSSENQPLGQHRATDRCGYSEKRSSPIMLYESDSSIQDDDDDEEEGEEANELLGNQPSTSSAGRRQRSEEIFTIQMASSQSDDSAVYSPIPKTPTYSHLETSDGGDEDASNRQPSFISSLSLGNLHKARSFLNRQKLIKQSKSDTQFHYIKRQGQGQINIGDVIGIDAARDANTGHTEESEDNVTLTSTSQGSTGRIPKRWSYDPGGSSMMTPWSTYSELLLEFQGFSWDCCVALIVRTCISEQCHAYTKFLKMAAWFTIFVLIVLCFRPQVYRTMIHQPGFVQDQAVIEHSGTQSLMDILHSNSSTSS